jgi:hypothetical protein
MVIGSCTFDQVRGRKLPTHCFERSQGRPATQPGKRQNLGALIKGKYLLSRPNPQRPQASTVPLTNPAGLPCLIIRLIIQTIRQDPPGSD